MVKKIAIALLCTALGSSLYASEQSFGNKGFIGLEVGTLLKQTHPDLKVTVVEFLAHPLAAMLDGDMAAKVASYLAEQGIELRTSTKVMGITEKDG